MYMTKCMFIAEYHDHFILPGETVKEKKIRLTHLCKDISKSYPRSLVICCKCIECSLSNSLYDPVTNFPHMKMSSFHVLLVLRIITIHGIQIRTRHVSCHKNMF